MFEAFVAITCGIVLNYGLVLLLQSLNRVQFVACTLSVLGLGIFVFHCLRSKVDVDWSKRLNIRIGWILAVLLGVLFANLIMTDPIYEWDPRSIWFFHGKMIYYAGALSDGAGFLHSSAAWSHPDYPKLVPALAAQAANLAEFWNEYLPKTSIFVLLLPALLLVGSLTQRSLSFVFLVLAFPLSIGEFLWNGYMDGLFGLYFSLSLLMLGKFAVEKTSTHLVSSILCLLLLIYLKNEGQLALLVWCVTFLLAKFTAKHAKSALVVSNTPSMSQPRLLLLALLFLPFVLWEFYKDQWGLTNDLQILSMKSINSVSERLTDGSTWVILTYAFEETAGHLVICMAAVISLYASRLAPTRGILVVFFAGSLYALGILLIYHLTHHELDWHLRTSIDRTMLPVSGALLVISYLALEHVEQNAKAP